MARFYANENFPLPIVETLLTLGHDVLTTQQANQANQAVTDEEVLAFAHSEQRILLTFNRRHFIRLHTENIEHSGIMVCTYDADFAALADRIHAGVIGTSDTSGQLFRINRPNR